MSSAGKILGFGLIGALLTAPFVMDMKPGEESDEETQEDLEVEPDEGMRAFVMELVSQAKVDKGSQYVLVRLLRELRFEVGHGEGIAVPVGEEISGLPSADEIQRIASWICSAYGCALSSLLISYDLEEGPIDFLLVVFDEKKIKSQKIKREGTALLDELYDSSAEEIEEDFEEDKDDPIVEESFGAIGNILDFVVESVAASAIGTVTSLAMQGLIRSAGGEARLARLVRRYKRALRNEEKKRAAHLLKKIAKTASRIKGRRVDWREVSEILEDYEE